MNGLSGVNNFVISKMSTPKDIWRYEDRVFNPMECKLATRVIILDNGRHHVL